VCSYRSSLAIVTWCITASCEIFKRIGTSTKDFVGYDTQASGGLLKKSFRSVDIRNARAVTHMGEQI
jgi:hypothetical protein